MGGEGWDLGSTPCEYSPICTFLYSELNADFTPALTSFPFICWTCQVRLSRVGEPQSREIQHRMLGISYKNTLLLRDKTVKVRPSPHPKYLGA